MATTTPNYGWTVPTSTDLVKDGATAIETLGDAIDASMNTALGTKKAGMVLLNTTSFSAVASQSINDVFSATYTNYLLNVEIIADTFREIRFRLRVSGSDNSTTGYQYQNLNGGGSTASALRTTGQTSFQWCYLDGAGRAGVVSEIFNPFATQTTAMLTRTNQFSSVAIENTNNAQAFNATTSFTGFTIYPTAGTITGSLRVYGYNN